MNQKVVVKSEKGPGKAMTPAKKQSTSSNNVNDLCMVNGTIGHCVQIFADNGCFPHIQLLFVIYGQIDPNTIQQRSGVSLAFTLKDSTAELGCSFTAVDSVKRLQASSVGLIYRLIDWLIDLLINTVIDWLIDLLFHLISFVFWKAAIANGPDVLVVGMISPGNAHNDAPCMQVLKVRSVTKSNWSNHSTPGSAFLRHTPHQIKNSQYITFSGRSFFLVLFFNVKYPLHILKVGK